MYRNEILTGKEDRGLGVEARQATNNVRASSMCPATISRMHTLEASMHTRYPNRVRARTVGSI